MSDKRRAPARLVVPSGKVTGYLLKLDHPRGGSKAKFFSGVGFDDARVEEFADALFTHATHAQTEVAFVADGEIEKMVCVGPLQTPNGRLTRIRSIWVMTGPDDAQLVTAVPERRRTPG